MHRSWCGEKCCDCGNPCRMDEVIPCSLDCENLTENGHIKVKECLEAKCDAIYAVFKDAADQEILQEYGPIAEYPY